MVTTRRNSAQHNSSSTQEVEEVEEVSVGGILASPFQGEQVQQVTFPSGTIEEMAATSPLVTAADNAATEGAAAESTEGVEDATNPKVQSQSSFMRMVEFRRKMKGVELCTHALTFAADVLGHTTASDFLEKTSQLNPTTGNVCDLKGLEEAYEKSLHKDYKSEEERNIVRDLVKISTVARQVWITRKIHGHWRLAHPTEHLPDDLDIMWEWAKQQNGRLESLSAFEGLATYMQRLHVAPPHRKPQLPSFSEYYGVWKHRNKKTEADLMMWTPPDLLRMFDEPSGDPVWSPTESTTVGFGLRAPAALEDDRSRRDGGLNASVSVPTQSTPAGGGQGGPPSASNRSDRHDVDDRGRNVTAHDDEASNANRESAPPSASSDDGEASGRNASSRGVSDTPRENQARPPSAAPKDSSTDDEDGGLPHPSTLSHENPSGGGQGGPPSAPKDSSSDGGGGGDGGGPNPPTLAHDNPSGRGQGLSPAAPKDSSSDDGDGGGPNPPTLALDNPSGGGQGGPPAALNDSSGQVGDGRVPNPSTVVHEAPSGGGQGLSPAAPKDSSSDDGDGGGPNPSTVAHEAPSGGGQARPPASSNNSSSDGGDASARNTSSHFKDTPGANQVRAPSGASKDSSSDDGDDSDRNISSVVRVRAAERGSVPKPSDRRESSFPASQPPPPRQQRNNEELLTPREGMITRKRAASAVAPAVTTEPNKRRGVAAESDGTSNEGTYDAPTRKGHVPDIRSTSRRRQRESEVDDTPEQTARRGQGVGEAPRRRGVFADHLDFLRVTPGPPEPPFAQHSTPPAQRSILPQSNRGTKLEGRIGNRSFVDHQLTRFLL
jgi:hypothetical protein